MQQTETMAVGEKKKVSPLILLVGGILAVCALFLFMPSSRASKTIKAKAKLAKEFGGPKDISYLYAATMVTDKNVVRVIARGEKAVISVFAPKPTDTVPSSFFSMGSYYSGGTSAPTPNCCILAPDPTSTGWTLYAKVWIAMALQKKTNENVAWLGNTVLSASSSASSQLKGMWAKTPPNIQAEAEAILDHNRMVTKGLPGVHQYYQDGKGVNYEVSSKRQLWEFYQTFYEAYPDLRSN